MFTPSSDFISIYPSFAILLIKSYSIYYLFVFSLSIRLHLTYKVLKIMPHQGPILSPLAAVVHAHIPTGLRVWCPDLSQCKWTLSATWHSNELINFARVWNMAGASFSQSKIEKGFNEKLTRNLWYVIYSSNAVYFKILLRILHLTIYYTTLA